MNSYLQQAYSLIKELRAENNRLEEAASKADSHEGPEVVVGSYPLDEATNLIVQYIENSKAFKNGSKPNLGTFARSYGYGKVVGISSLDGKVKTRIDFSPDKGYHYHFEDYRKKKSVNYCVLINNMNEKAYEHYINSLTKRYAEYSSKNNDNEYELPLEFLFYRKNKVNIALLKTIKRIYPYSFLDTIDPSNNLEPDLFELICYVEELIDNGLTSKYRNILEDYYAIAERYSNWKGFLNYLDYCKIFASLEEEQTIKSHKLS